MVIKMEAIMMKQNYERVNLTVFAFGAKDVITTSGGPTVLPEDPLF